MRLALAWRWKGEPPTPREATAVLERLAARFQPLFKSEPQATLRSVGPVHLASLELPVQGWTFPAAEDDGDDWAFAPEPPLNAGRLLGAPPGEPLLVPLGRALRRDPAAVLRELIPPASLLASDAADGSFHAFTDGLGQGQLFEVETDRLWAISNRPSAFLALGIPLRPVPLEWATRFTLGWFPEGTTGYEGVRVLSPGEHVRVDAAGIRRETTDILGDWIHPEPMSADDALELARTSMVDYLEGLLPYMERPSLGLSGGWDSRAVASIMRSLDAPHQLRVRGHPERIDVMVAVQLAKMADMPIRVKAASGFPPNEPDELRTCLEKALLWHAGYMTLLKQKTFLSRKPQMDGGVVNLMGQHSGIGKADFAVDIAAHELEPDQYEDALLAFLMKPAPDSFTAATRQEVRERLRSCYRAADRYDLEGVHRLHFFYLNEFTRRWGAATVNSQTGIVVTPFLNPGLIRAAYAFPPERIPEKPFHSHVTGHHAPDWAAYPYENQLSSKMIKAGAVPPVEGVRVQAEKDPPPWRRVRRWGKYDHCEYWNHVGHDLVSEALAEGGFLSELFDADRLADEWRQRKGVADAIATAHLIPKTLG